MYRKKIFSQVHKIIESNNTDNNMASAITDYILHLKIEKTQLFEKKIHENCNIEYSRTTGEEMVNSSMSAVLIAFEEYLNELS